METFRGKAVLADFREVEAAGRLGPWDLKRALPRHVKDRIILLGTGWGDKRADAEQWNRQIPHLSPDGAHWLVEKGVRAVGIDHWSVGGPEEPADSLTHTILMASNVWIIENMYFPEEVYAIGEAFECWCLPVNMPKLTGALCRPVAVVRGKGSQRKG